MCCASLLTVTDTCPACGVELHVGDFPFCPHGKGMSAAIPDDVPGGFTVENGFDRPRVFYSKTEHLRALKEEGCELRPKWAGPLDRHLTNWAAGIDPYTLDAATALVSRRSRSQTDDGGVSLPARPSPSEASC